MSSSVDFPHVRDWDEEKLGPLNESRIREIYSDKDKFRVGLAHEFDANEWSLEIMRSGECFVLDGSIDFKHKDRVLTAETGEIVVFEDGEFYFRSSVPGFARAVCVWHIAKYFEPFKSLN